MALAVLNQAEATYVDQSAPDARDFDAIVAGFRGNGVVSGMAVSQRAAGANLTVDVAAGTVQLAGAQASQGSVQNVAVSVDATNPRFVLIVTNSAGVASAIAGTPAAAPIFPTFNTTTQNLLAAIYVPAGATTILNANIVDKRIIIEMVTTVAGRSGDVTIGAADVQPGTYPVGAYTYQGDVSFVSGNDLDPELLSLGRASVELVAGVDVAAGQLSDSTAGDFVARITDTAKTYRFGFGAAGVNGSAFSFNKDFAVLKSTISGVNISGIASQNTGGGSPVIYAVNSTSKLALLGVAGAAGQVISDSAQGDAALTWNASNLMRFGYHTGPTAFTMSHLGGMHAYGSDAGYYMHGRTDASKVWLSYVSGTDNYGIWSGTAGADRLVLDGGGALWTRGTSNGHFMYERTANTKWGGWYYNGSIMSAYFSTVNADRFQLYESGQVQFYSPALFLPNQANAFASRDYITAQPSSKMVYWEISRFSSPTTVEVASSISSPSWTTSGAPTAASIANLMCGRTDQPAVNLTTALPALRLTFNKTGAWEWGNIDQLMLGFTYTGYVPTMRVVVETSPDGTTWAQRADTGSGWSVETAWWQIPLADHAGNGWFRISIYATLAASQFTPLKYIGLYSRRVGEGAGSYGGPQNEAPYTWDRNKVVTFPSGISFGNGSQAVLGMHSDGSNIYIEAAASGNHIYLRPNGPANNTGYIDVGVTSTTVNQATFAVRTGSAPGSFDIGRSSAEGHFGVVNGAGEWFSNTVAGDVILRVNDTTKTLRLGLGGGTSKLDILNGSVLARVDLNTLGNLYENSVRVYSPSNKPTAADIAAATFPTGTFTFQQYTVWATGYGSLYNMTSGNQGKVVGSGTALFLRGGTGGMIWRDNADTVDRMSLSDAGLLTVGGTGTTGYTTISPGDATHTGYIGFTAATGTRQGYIGWSTSTAGPADTGTVNFQMGHAVFSGDLTVSGVSTSTVNGGTPYTSATPPPYPVTSVAGRGSAVTLDLSDIAAGTAPAGTFVFPTLNATSDVQRNGVSLPRGILSHVRLTADTTQNITSSSATTVTGTRTVDYATAAAGNFSTSLVGVITGRAYKVSYSGQAKSSVANDQASSTITMTAGTATMSGSSPASRVVMPTANGPISQRIEATFKCTAGGTAQWSLQTARPVGTGNVNHQADSQIVVEDLGVI